MLKPNSLFRCLSKKDHRQKNKGDEKQVVVTKTSSLRLPNSRNGRNNNKDGMVVASTASRLPHSTQQPQQEEWTRAPPRMVETLVEVNTLTVEEIDRQQEQPSSSRNRPILRLERRIRSHQKANKQRQEEENAMEKAIQQCFSWKWPKDIMDSNQDGVEEEDVPFDEKMDIPFDEEEDDVGNMPVTKKEEEDDLWPFGIDLKFMKRSSLAIATETSKTPAKNTNNNKEVLSAAANTGTPDTAPMEEDEHQRQEEELVGMAATALSYSETPKHRTKTRSWRQRQRLQPMKKKGGDFISDLTFGLLSCNSKKPTTSPTEKKNEEEEEDNDESIDEGGGFKGCHHHAIRELFCHSA